MARGVADAKLETRTQRLKLRVGIRHFRSVGKGVALSYRRTAAGFGNWGVRLAQPGGRYVLRALGSADDHLDADGTNVFDFFQAQELARKAAASPVAQLPERARMFTVGEAAKQYLAWFRVNRKSVHAATITIHAHILPAFGRRSIQSLTATELRKWHASLAEQPARLRTAVGATKLKLRPPPVTDDQKRARRATANRILAMMKALLNRAVQDEDNQLPPSFADAWRLVKPFKNTDHARIRFLTDVEAPRLVGACPPDLRLLVSAALLTGARYGELAEMRVRDVNVVNSRVFIPVSKSGRSRHIPLNSEGQRLFAAAVEGKELGDYVFKKTSGRPWGKNLYSKSLKLVCASAGIEPPVRFHELRHTYASHLAQAGVPLLTIATLLGHADTRITARHYAHLSDKTLIQAVTQLPSFMP
jgi:integrase